MGLLDGIMDDTTVEDNEVQPVTNESMHVDGKNILEIDATLLEPIIGKFSFLSKNKQLEDQIIKIFCINGSMFICASNIRYFYSTLIKDVTMSSKPFDFNIPYKQLTTIIKAGIKGKSTIKFEYSDFLIINTNKTTWELPLIAGSIEIENVLEYYKVETFKDEVYKKGLVDVLKMYQPFVNTANETLVFNEGYVFCRSNHFYIWTMLELKDSYILSKESLKLILTLADSTEEYILLNSLSDKLLIRCGDDVIATDRIYGNTSIMSEIAELAPKQSVYMYKKSLQESLREIDIYNKRDLTISFEPDGFRLINRAGAKGTAETMVEINKELTRVTTKDTYNISFDILEECVKCIKEDVVELNTLNRTEYIQFRTTTLNCILMVNY